jgi:Kef-type K+ transport system membrane component KefB
MLLQRMSAFSFLPDWPLIPDAVLWAGLALLLAGLCGEWCWRVWRIPRVSGYGLIGLVAGGLGLKPVSPELISYARLAIDVALGLLLFELGSRFSLRWVRNNPWIIVTSLAESVLCFVTVALVLKLLGVSSMTALVVGGIAMSTSPSLVIQLKNELKSEGQVSDRLMALAALNSIYAVLVVKLASGWFHQAFYGDALATVVQPLYLLIGSLLLAFVLAQSCHFLYKRFPEQNDHAFVMLFGLVLVAIAIAHVLKLSTILALLSAGMMFKNVSERPQILTSHFGSAGWLLTVILFVLVPLGFEWHDVAAGALLAIVVVVVRTLAKTAGVVVFARASGIDWKKGVALGLSMSPMSALSFVLIDDTYSLYPAFDPALRAIVMCSIVILQIVSPIVVYRALSAVNECNLERKPDRKAESKP